MIEKLWLSLKTKPLFKNGTKVQREKRRLSNKITVLAQKNKLREIKIF